MKIFFGLELNKVRRVYTNTILKTQLRNEKQIKFTVTFSFQIQMDKSNIQSISGNTNIYKFFKGKH